MGMDTRTGGFVPVTGELFRQGEEVDLKGVKFRVDKIADDTVTLRTCRSIEMGDAMRDFRAQMDNGIENLTDRFRPREDE